MDANHSLKAELSKHAHVLEFKSSIFVQKTTLKVKIMPSNDYKLDLLVGSNIGTLKRM
jgi:hypothetical protein